MLSSNSRYLIRALVPKRFHRTLRWIARIRQPRRAYLNLSIPAAPAVASPYSFAIAHDNPLKELGDKYRPTKRLHNYLPYYWAHFRDIRHQVRSVLEIGLETDRSLRMWEEFFPNAEIIGVDIDPKCRAFEGARRRVLTGHQGDHAFLKSLVDSTTYPIDVVIDDGSHLVKHQIASFNYLFPRMSSHGIYVIEDTGGVVEDFHLATVNAMKSLIDNTMHWPCDFPASNWLALDGFGDEASWMDKNVVGVAFYRWMVVIMRGRNPRDNPYLGSSHE